MPNDKKNKKDTPPPSPPHPIITTDVTTAIPDLRTTSFEIHDTVGKVVVHSTDHRTAANNDNNNNADNHKEEVLNNSNDTNNHNNKEREEDDDLDLGTRSGLYARSNDDDLDRLLGHMDGFSTESNSSRHRAKKSKKMCCGGAHKVGNTIVLCPNLYSAYGIGVVGPHWWGMICTLGLLYGASFYFARKAWQEIGIGSFILCGAFSILCTVGLFFTGCVDPGVVRNRSIPQQIPSGDGVSSDWRYCDLCSVYQPPNAAHCPDCGVCIAGYDHHCPWMGTCIGKRNFKAFMTFNISWLLYLIYAIVWVSVLGPRMNKT